MVNTQWANMSPYMSPKHTDAVVSFESFRALKLTLFASFRVLKSYALFENFRALCLSILESFRGLKVTLFENIRVLKFKHPI
jgi:hypothetical protein